MRKKNQALVTLFNLKGAGRPRLAIEKRRSIPHRTRESFKKGTPVHVTIKLKKNIVFTLRNKTIFQKIAKAVQKARLKKLRIIHFTVQKDHLHLLLEATDKIALGKSLQSLGISLSKSLTHLLKRSGSVYKERYHVHILKSIREIKNAKLYILGNAVKHGVIKDKFDTFSSVIKEPKIAWQFDFEKYFSDLLHFLDYEKIISDLVDSPKFFLTKKGLG